MTEIRANFPLQEMEMTVTATGANRDITDDFMLAYSLLSLAPQRKAVFKRCIEAVLDAEARHKDFALYKSEMLCIILEELGEAAKAYNDGDKDNVLVELSHTVATCIRAMETISKTGD